MKRVPETEQAPWADFWAKLGGDPATKGKTADHGLSESRRTANDPEQRFPKPRFMRPVVLERRVKSDDGSGNARLFESRGGGQRQRITRGAGKHDRNDGRHRNQS